MRPLIVALALVPTTLSAQPAPPAAPQYGPPAPVADAAPATEAAPAAQATPADAPPPPAYAPPPPAYAPPPPPRGYDPYATYYASLFPPPAPRQRPAIGVSLGGFHTKSEAMNGTDASGTYGLFGRLGLTPHLFTQLDVARIDRDDRWKVYAWTASIAYAFGSSRLTPILRAGGGYDSAQLPGSDGRSALRVEIGAGLEARLGGGLLLGLDLAAGRRGASEQIYCAYGTPDDGGFYFDGDDFCKTPLVGGSYRSAKVTLGVAF